MFSRQHCDRYATALKIFRRSTTRRLVATFAVCDPRHDDGSSV